MSVLRQFQTYYGIYLPHWETDWGGDTYHSLLVKELPSQYLVSEDYINDTEATFIYPSMYASKYYLDGQIEGHISIFNTSTTNDDVGSVTDYTVTLKKSSDEPNSEETLATVTRVISSDNSVPTEDYLTLPIYMPIDKKLVEANEKLMLYVSFSTGTDPTDGDLVIACANSSSPDYDIKMKIPYAPSGG